MTAIVGVLNKHAVAIAADSAVTMGNTHKVVNCANKIFTLSKCCPVAVMTYNDAAFMGVPWDIIIKEYRKCLRERSFPQLEGYVTDFIDFLHKRHFFCDDATQREFLRVILNKFYEICCAEICRNENIKHESLTSALIEDKLSQCLADNKSAKKCSEFVSYTFDDFIAFADTDIKQCADGMGISNYKLLAESFFYYLTADFSESVYTGLVFVGYGEDEIYPSLLCLHVSIGVDGRLKYVFKEITKISEHGTAAVIIPFAQVDVTQTIVRGINPSFQNIISNVIAASMKSFSTMITDIIDTRSGNEDISSAIKGLDVDVRCK